MKSLVKKHMSSQQITLRGMARDTGLDQKTILRARDDEKIKTCTLGVLEVIAQRLGVPITALFRER
jgi:hypothetical protein